MARKPVTADKYLHIRVTSDQLERWKAEAEKERITLSDLVKKSLDQACRATAGT